MQMMVPTLICLAVGLVLLVVEVFTPGLGVAGGIGALALLGAVLMQIGNPVGILFMIALVLFVIAIALILFLRLGSKGRFDKSKIVLSEQIQADGSGLIRQDYQTLIGQVGVAETVLRPSGKACFQGRTVDVVTAGEFILKGRQVQVVSAEGLRVLVRAFQAGE